MNRLHSERGFLSECVVDSSHKGGEGVYRRRSLQQNKNLPTGEAGSSSVQPAFTAWHGRESGLMRSNVLVRATSDAMLRAVSA
jgi:hypothetical protein